MTKIELIKNNPEAFLGMLDDKTTQSWYFESGTLEVGGFLKGFHFWQGGPLSGWTSIGYGGAHVVAKRDGLILLQVVDFEASWVVALKEVNRVNRGE